MSSELAIRLIGMVILALAGARFGTEVAVPPLTPDVFALIFGLVGALIGLILTPYATTRPARLARHIIRELPAARRTYSGWRVTCFAEAAPAQAPNESRLTCRFCWIRRSSSTGGCWTSA